MVIGSLVGMSGVSLLYHYNEIPMLLASFGASACLLFGAPQAPMAQPRNCLGGHLISALVGITVFQIWGFTWWSMAVAVTLAILLMLLSDTMHPAGVATCMLAVGNGVGYGFILNPLMLGVILLVFTALVVNNLFSGQKYPTRWL